jgi:predicted O-methyltransferase YrrM
MEANDVDDRDSSYGASIATDTTSIKSDVYNYRYEHGRRYHAYKAGQYLYPNDDDALSQMDIEHHNQGLMLGKLYMSPIKDPGEILDIGTGTGIWAIDMADMFPSATITGTDLSPTQPTWVPSNVKFEVDDFTEDW